ncbi:MAG: hypothetical protein PHU63_04155, partial [Candidatus ainarchaeum sp.]|nr:hypothetical protein [Candidatus ainarchaeum sp.]
MLDQFTDPLNSIIYGIGAFIISFVLLSVFWSAFIRIMESVFSKSKLYFIPSVLKEINRSIFIAILLVSIYFGVMFYDFKLIESALMKLWGVVLILVIAEAFASVLLGIIDNYYSKAKKTPTFVTNGIPLMKRLIGIIVYSVAVLIVINYLSSEVGIIIASVGLLVLVFLFIIYYEQLRNMMAGLQLIGGH